MRLVGRSLCVAKFHNSAGLLNCFSPRGGRACHSRSQLVFAARGSVFAAHKCVCTTQSRSLLTHRKLPRL